MAHEFDKQYWERHWHTGAAGSMAAAAANPYLLRETAGLVPGTALDAGCGAGAEAIALAERGWQVTAADISATALAQAAARAEGRAAAGRLRWVEADLSTWEPRTRFDLVMTHYAHPAMSQLDFYDRIAAWVADGGTLLVVGHREDSGGHGHAPDDAPPPEASVTAATVAARLDAAAWDVVTAAEPDREQPGIAGPAQHLRDVVVRAVRRG